MIMRVAYPFLRLVVGLCRRGHDVQLGQSVTLLPIKSGLLWTYLGLFVRDEALRRFAPSF